MGITRRGLLLVAGVCWKLRAQEPAFSTGVDVVTLLATVRDRDGGVVKDLKQEDFTLQVDGKAQPIRYFSRESDLPLTIGLLVDTSRSQTGVLEPERRASYKFLDQVLRDSDTAFVAHFDTAVEVLQGFTSSRQELAAALERLRIPGRVATLIYQAIKQTSEDMMRPRTGRKAFILLSDGVSYGDKTNLETAIEYAQRADTMIYSILFADKVRMTRPGRAAVQAIAAKHGKGVMQRLSRETGGAFFEVSDREPIEKVYAEIEDALRSEYSLGFTPKPGSKSGQYHKIKLTVAPKGLAVQTREGYYSR